MNAIGPKMTNVEILDDPSQPPDVIELRMGGDEMINRSNASMSEKNLTEQVAWAGLDLVAEEPIGPRTGEHGFRSFCRNKRASSCRGETLP